MAQNINLIEDLVLQETSAFNSKLAIKILLWWLAGLVLVYILTYGLEKSRQKTLSRLKSTQQSLELQIKNYNKQLSPFKRHNNLKNLPTSSTNTIGFYRYLEDLSRFIPHGVWLKTIKISEPDETIKFEGSAIIASSVSALINSLSGSDDFKNKKFDAVQLKENLETGNTDFVVSTISENQKGKNNKNELNNK